MKRCAWANPKNPRYIDYHDKDWGQPVYDDTQLFEMLILEGAQAGLSWETILNKRPAYREAFYGFNIQRVAELSDAELETLRHNAGIVRNRLKIAAARKNAQAVLKIQAEHGSFAKYLWDYVDGRPIQNNFQHLEDIPAETDLSLRISKDLKKYGMTFVGPTIIYAFMQAIGMVNDHTTDCFRYAQVQAMALPI